MMTVARLVLLLLLGRRDRRPPSKAFLNRLRWLPSCACTAARSASPCEHDLKADDVDRDAPAQAGSAGPAKPQATKITVRRCQSSFRTSHSPALSPHFDSSCSARSSRAAWSRLTCSVCEWCGCGCVRGELHAGGGWGGRWCGERCNSKWSRKENRNEQQQKRGWRRGRGEKEHGGGS